MTLTGSTYRTRVVLTIWPVTLDEMTGLVPEDFVIRFDGDEVDLEGSVVLGLGESEAQVVLWNVGDPVGVLPVLRRGFLAALDMGRGPPGLGGVTTRRVVTGRLGSVTVRDDPETGEVALVVPITPTAEATRDILVKAGFPDRDSPYRLRAVIEELFKLAKLSLVQVRVDEDLFLDSFVADGPLASEVRRAAASAGAFVGVWDEGGVLVVSDHFEAGADVGQEVILDVVPADVDSPVFTPPRDLNDPLLEDDSLVAGGSLDVGEDVDLSTEEDQIAALSPPPGSTYEFETLLLPEASPGSVLKVRGAQALSRAGLLNQDVALFNVHEVRHSFSSLDQAGLDTTRLVVALRSEVEE